MDPVSSSLVEYVPISDTTAICSMIIDSVFNRPEYQEYLESLEDGKIKKAERIRATFGTIQAYGTADAPLFLAKDIGIIMGMDHVLSIVRNYDDELDKVDGFVVRSGKQERAVFLTDQGVYRLIHASRSPLAKLFRRFICQLIRHMYTHELSKTRKIFDRIVADDPELAQAAREDLLLRLDAERTARLRWEECAEDEHEQRLEAERLLARSEIAAEVAEARVRDFMRVAERPVMTDESRELDVLRRRFLKEMHVYVVRPTQPDEEFEWFVRTCAAAPDMVSCTTMPFYLAFGNKPTNDKLHYVCREWVFGKDSFVALVSDLAAISDVVPMGAKKSAYMTTLDTIWGLAAESRSA